MQIRVTSALLLVLICCGFRQSIAAEPHIVAHRGLLRHAPENTLGNFRACLELRLGFEFDVQATSDGHLVCIHDGMVDRTTNGSGKVSEMTLTEIRQLDAGRWFDPQYSGEKIPTVEEVLKLIAEYQQLDLVIAVDLKAENVEAAVARMADQNAVLDKLVFIGRAISEPSVRDRILAVSRRAHIAAVANNPDEFSATLAVPNADCVYFRYLPATEHMNAVRKAGKRSFIAGVTVSGNVPPNWKKASDLGIDAILTDYPLELRAALRQETHP